MGLVLDSDVLIGAERERQSVTKLLLRLRQDLGETEIVLSSISVVELEHGYYRAQTPEQARVRRDYLDAVFTAVPIQPFTAAMASVAARIDAEARLAGRTIAFADLLIGATALHFGYAVATRNVRHFSLIPGLAVTRL